jgi:hypothetical protein
VRLFDFLSSSPRRGWTRTTFPGNLAWIHHPNEWTVDDHGEFKVICTPGERACFGLSSFGRHGASLAEFVESRLRTERDLAPVGRQYAVRSRHWTAIGHDFRGRFSSDEFETYRVVLCATRHDVFVSLTLNTSPDLFAQSQELFRSVQRTLRFRCA